MHVAIIRFSSMGDVVLQSSFINWLKTYHKDIKITFVTLANFKDIYEGHPFIENLITIPKKKGLEDLKQLRLLGQRLQNDCDLIFDLHGTLRSQIINLFNYKKPFIKVDKRSFKRWLLVKFKINLLKKLESHHERINKDFQFLFDTKISKKNLIENLTKQTKLQAGSLTSLGRSFIKDQSPLDKRYIVISPVASFKSKRWPLQNVSQLILKLLHSEKLKSYIIVIIAGPEDTYVEEIYKYGVDPDEIRLKDYQGKTSLLDTINFIKHSELVVTNDTGATHFAEALGVPSLSLFGSTSESFGFRPHLEKSRSISRDDLACRPCSATGKKDCFKQTNECLRDISAETVFKYVEDTLC